MRWAQVTQVSPVRVQLNGDTTPLPYEPPTAIDATFLSVDDMVMVERVDSLYVIVGRSAGVSPPDLLRRNLIRNARFRVNQRGAVSGASLADGAFFLDGWRNSVGAVTSLIAWTGSDDEGRVLTLGNAGNLRNVSQTIERRDVVPGDYMLIWEGDCTARVWNEGGSAPAFAAGPLSVTLDGAANVVVEFQGEGDTLSRPMLVRADADPGYFPDICYADDLRWCQRYYWQMKATVAGQKFFQGFQVLTNSSNVAVVHPVPMRVAPSVIWSGLRWTDDTSFNATVSSLYINEDMGATNLTRIRIVHASAGAIHRTGSLGSNTSDALLAFSAEL